MDWMIVNYYSPVYAHKYQNIVKRKLSIVQLVLSIK